MIYTLIAVAVVLGLLIGFVTLSVLWTALRVGRNIRERSLELISAYDEMLETRSRELSAVETELENRRSELVHEPDSAAEPEPAQAPASPDPTAFLKVVEQISATSYIDGSAGEAYQRIRQTFGNIREETVRELVSQPREAGQNTADALLQALRFDTIYQLSTLPGSEQLRLLRETIPASMRKVLDDYVSAAKHFDCIAFYDALKAASAAESGAVKLYVASQDVRLYPASLDVMVDENICEGFQVELDSVLYDYAIKTGEIG